MTALIATKNEYALIKQQAADLVSSGFLPLAVNTPEKVVAIMTLGRELNIPTWQAINNIVPIQGKPCVSPQLMLALIRKSRQLKSVKIESDEKSCSVTMLRKGEEFPHTEIFSVEDAQRMGLLFKDNWKKQPKTMLKWRAVAACARVVFSDVIMGLYSAEELDPNISVDSEGEIISVESKVVERAPETVRGRSEEPKNTHENTPKKEVKKLPEKAHQKQAEKLPEKVIEKVIEKEPIKKEEIIEHKLKKIVSKQGSRGELWLRRKMTALGVDYADMSKEQYDQLKSEAESLIEKNIEERIVIDEEQWKYPWMSLAEKNYTREEAEAWIRDRYAAFKNPDGSTKTSTKELNTAELQVVLQEINLLEPKPERVRKPEVEDPKVKEKKFALSELEAAIQRCYRLNETNLVGPKEMTAFMLYASLIGRGDLVKDSNLLITQELGYLRNEFIELAESLVGL